MARPWERAERTISPGAVAALASGSASAVTSLLLEAFRRRAERLGPADVARRHRDDAFVRPSDIDQRTLLRLDAVVAEAIPAFEAIELAPVVPLATCSAVAKASQNKVLATVRATEVVADPTNALALIAAERRERDPVVRLATSHRVLRGQRFTEPGYQQHFRLWGLVTAGRDPGGRAFESEALREHVEAHHAVLAALRRAGLRLPAAKTRVLVTPSSRAWVEAAVAGMEVSWGSLDEDGYYAGVRFQVSVGGVPACDGGLVDWTARLRSDRKEKLVVSAVGTELLARRFGQAAAPLE